MKAKLSLSVCICLGLLTLTGPPARAADGTWTYDGNGNWSDTTKWLNGTVADGAGHTADFSTINITANRTVTLDSDRIIGTLKFGDTVSPIRAWTLSGTYTLTLSGSPTISAVVSGQTISIFVALAGTEGLTKTGPGTVTLIKANTYTGPTVILEGALEISSDSHLGTPPASATPGNIVINGGQLSFKGQFDLHPNRGVALGPETGSGAGTVHIATSTYVDAIPGIIANNGSGTGALVKTGPGTLVLSADNTYSGGTTISNGTLCLGTNSVTGSILGNVTTYATLAFNRSDSYTFNGVISGTGSLVQMGSGTVTLTANNTYSGGTTINAGRLAAASASGTGSAVGIGLF
jgi:fibronectin-binding autotransporter adhesin